MISNTKPSTYGYAGDAYWPAAGTVPKSVAPTVTIGGTTYGIVGEVVDGVYIKIEDSTTPGIDPVQASKLGLLAKGYFIYDPTTEELGEVIHVDVSRFHLDPTALYVKVDKTMTTAPGESIEVCRSNAMSISLINEGAVVVELNGVNVPQGGAYNASGFAETGQLSRAVTPVTYNSNASTDLKISVNP